MNHEFCASLCEDPVDQLKSESAQAVSVLNDNRRDKSAVYLVQKGDKSLPFEIEAGSDVLDDFVLGVGFLQELDLTFEVGFLVLAGDARVADVALFGFFVAFLVVTALRLGTGRFTEDSTDFTFTVEALPTGHAVARQPAIVGPLDESCIAHRVRFDHSGRRDVLFHTHTGGMSDADEE